MTLSTTFSAGRRVTATELQGIVTAVVGLQVPDMAIATRVASQSIPHATGTVLSCDTQVVDTNTMFAPTDSKIYAKRDGVYSVTAHVLCAGPNFMIIDLNINGSSKATQAAPTDASGVVRLSAATHVYMTTGQYLEVSIYQSSTGSVSRNATGRLTMTYCGATA